MAEKAKLRTVPIDWLDRDRATSEGLDHLGIQVVSVNIYSQLLPGLTNVTDRARFCAFYPWLLHRFASEGFEAGDRRRWIEWLRCTEYTYALCCAAVRKMDGVDITGVTGSIRARRKIRNLTAAAVVDVREDALLDEDGRVPKGAYIANLEGGYTQYDNALVSLGVLHPAPHLRYPDVQLTSYAGRPIAEALDDPEVGFLDLLKAAKAGTASISELAQIGHRVQPGAIRRGSKEQRLLRALILGTDDELCKGQDEVQRRWRRDSMLLALAFARSCDRVENDFADEFRWCCAVRSLPSGTRWSIAEPLEPVARAWALYHRNDLLCLALDSLLHACLLHLEEVPLSPRALAQQATEHALAAVTVNDDEDLPALGGTVAAWVEACRWKGDEDAASWGVSSTFTWMRALVEQIKAADPSTICALAVRLLGRLVTDVGSFDQHGFGILPQGQKIADPFEVHLGKWLNRVRERHDAELRGFLEELLLEWVLFRHLRVATRKLANQGVSTFMMRPEGGLLVRASDDLPTVGFTNPRLRQAHRYLVDLGYLEEVSKQTTLTKDGGVALEEAGL